jgi:hypothetical protein
LGCRTSSGEVYFEGDTIDSIQEVIDSIDKKIGKVRKEGVTA